MPGRVLEALRRNWWTFVLRGVCAILFGFFAWFWPGLTLLALIFTWATLACVNGVTTLVSSFARDGHEPRWILLLEGGVSLSAGLVALFYPRFTALLFLYLLAAWAVLSGLVEVIAAWRLRNEIRGEFWLGFAGVLSLLFGVMLVLRPGAGALTVVWLIAGYSVLFGVVLVTWGLHLRRLHHAAEQERLAHRVAAIGGAAGGHQPARQP
jgi:uncharacterized membrane protein HdeD (DUF308 family)